MPKLAPAPYNQFISNNVLIFIINIPMIKQIININRPPSSLLLLCLISLYLIELATSVCPANAQFLLAANNQCYAICPWESPNYYYSYLPTNTCELVCPGSYYGFDGNRSCTTACPSLPLQTFYDTVNKRCVSVCPANYFGYLGSVTASNQKCVQSKISLLYRLPHFHICRL